MRSVRDGQLDRLGALFERHHARVHALCARLTGHPDVADDLVQETMLRVLRYRRSWRGTSAFTTWLYALAYNVCHDYARRSRRDSAIAIDAGETGFAENAGAALDERHVVLDAALRRLSPDHRAVLVLRRYDDLSYDDIARVLACTPAAARVRAHRALHELREIYRELERRQHHLR